MNRKLVIGGLAAITAIGITVGGTTYSAWSDFGQIKDNSVSAGMLKLDLNAGSGSTKLGYRNLAPGVTTSAPSG